MLEATRPVGNRGLSLIGNVRGSVLWDNTDAVTSSELIAIGVNTSTNHSIVRDIDETLSIVEAQAGVEWSHNLQCCRGLVFARAVLEYQIWTSDVDRATTQTTDLGDFTVTVSNATSDTAFYGAAFTIGIAH